MTLPDGRELAWDEHGAPDGAPVFHFHGWPGSRVQGARYSATAARLGVRLISPDRPGYGRSTFQPRRAIRDWPADMAQLADALGLARFGVLGVSGGGPFALACAALLRERLNGVAVVSGVAPFTASGAWHGARPRDRLIFTALTRVPLLLRLALRQMAASARRDADGFLRHTWSSLPPVDRAIVSRPELAAISARDIREALRDGGRAAALEAGLLTRDWGFAIEHIRTPVDLWHGELDTIVRPAMGRFLAGAIPRCRARFLPVEGHYLVIPHAEDILAALRDAPSAESIRLGRHA